MEDRFPVFNIPFWITYDRIIYFLGIFFLDFDRYR